MMKFTIICATLAPLVAVQVHARGQHSKHDEGNRFESDTREDKYIGQEDEVNVPEDVTDGTESGMSEYEGGMYTTDSITQMPTDETKSGIGGDFRYGGAGHFGPIKGRLAVDGVANHDTVGIGGMAGAAGSFGGAAAMGAVGIDKEGVGFQAGKISKFGNQHHGFQVEGSAGRSGVGVGGYTGFGGSLGNTNIAGSAGVDRHGGKIKVGHSTNVGPLHSKMGLHAKADDDSIGLGSYAGLGGLLGGIELGGSENLGKRDDGFKLTNIPILGGIAKRLIS